MSRSTVKTCIEQYQRSRLCFIQTMAAFASKRHTSQFLAEFNVLDLIAPLLCDQVEAIQHAALVTLSKLMCAKRVKMKDVLRRGLISKVLKQYSKRNKYYKMAALGFLTCAVEQDERVANIIQKGTRAAKYILFIESENQSKFKKLTNQNPRMLNEASECFLFIESFKKN